MLVTPPDAAWPCGLLSVQVHEIRDLAVKTLGKERRGAKGREGAKGQDEGEETAEEAVRPHTARCRLNYVANMERRTGS